MALPVPDLHHLIAHYGLVVVAGLILLESMGLPVPGETVLVAAAIFAGTTQELHIGAIVLAAIGGAVVGNMIGFWVGRYFGYRLLLRSRDWLRLTETRIKIGQYLFLRYGGKVVALARFVPVLRSFVAILAGINCMPQRQFLVATSVGAAAWATLIGGGAYYLGEHASGLAAPAGIALGLIASALVITAGVLLGRYEKQIAVEAERQFPGPLQPAR